MRNDIRLGMLPDPFLFEDGHRVQSEEDWRQRREEIIRSAIGLEYDGMPPEPDEVWTEVLQERGEGAANSYRVHCLIDGKDFTFCFMVYRPFREGPCAAVVTGDAIYNTSCDDAVIAEANRRGFAVVRFNRMEFAPYWEEEPERQCGIDRYFPGHHFSTISAWAWGYLRVVDALMTLNYIHSDHIAITGHSRGGKTVLLAGAVDERIRYVNPNASGTHGCGCYRFVQQEDEILFENPVSESLGYMCRKYGHWMGSGMADYAGRENELPHDSHFIKALIAPRVLLETNAYSDIWANPRGSYLSNLAAREVWRMYGCEENCLTWYRNGIHDHGFADFSALFDVMESCITDSPLPYAVQRAPYTDMEPLHNWSCPVLG